MSQVNRFAQKLGTLVQLEDPAECSRQSPALMREFLKLGSDTQDNVNCTEHIEYGPIHQPIHGVLPGTSGLKVKGKDILIAEVLNYVEGIEIPEPVKTASPDLTPNEWDAVLRMATMVFIAFDRRD